MTYLLLSIVVAVLLVVVFHYTLHKPYKLTTNATGYLIVYLFCLVFWPIVLVVLVVDLFID